MHLWHTLKRWPYLKGFLATVLLATGGFMLMPFGSQFSQFNLGIDVSLLWVLYLITGLFSMGTGPLVGKLSDKVGKYKVFVFGSVLSAIVVVFYCNLGLTPFLGTVCDQLRDVYWNLSTDHFVYSVDECSAGASGSWSIYEYQFCNSVRRGWDCHLHRRTDHQTKQRTHPRLKISIFLAMPLLVQWPLLL